jgi:phospholipid/cholesterol/gamma-HCH transport system permease protein
MEDEDAQPVGQLVVTERGDTLHLEASGDWTLRTVELLDGKIRKLEEITAKAISVDISAVTEMDTSGAWLIERLRRRLLERGIELDVAPLADTSRGRGLVSVLKAHKIDVDQALAGSPGFSFLAPLRILGEMTLQAWRDFIMACNILGACIQGSQLKASNRSSIRATAIISQLDQMGRQAVPVIGVMSLLIGGILAQQSAYQLKFFGEELLTVDLVGILLLREIGVLLTAIMVAGRTGSAITAEIGMMKQREEIDALQVMGLNAVGVLILPRLIALLIALPILTFLADLAGLLGAIIVCFLYVGITPDQFLAAFETGVGGEPFIVGLVKAPFMALVIGLVATIEGLKVGGSAESLGKRTTESVVRAIFIVIFMDGVFAIFFASIGF